MIVSFFIKKSTPVESFFNEDGEMMVEDEEQMDDGEEEQVEEEVEVEEGYY
jgi:hypothetical protein